jgi:septum formation protein
MLHKLSGNTHEVFTGVTLTTTEKQRSFYAETKVTFAQLSDEEIVYYVDKYQPFDKAGSYGVQEWVGYIGVERIEGSYFNVMGLPVQRLYRELKAF